MDYVVHGKMIGGFALVAYPALYRRSGVMTFIVNQEGTVYQRDLGSRTAAVASRMTTFNPGQFAYTASRHCECCAPSWPAAPPGPRKTIGTLNCPPDMRRILAALLMI